MGTRYSIGIDEVGRGPLAGPVAVGVVFVPADFNWDLLPGVTDSKKLSPEKRLRLYNAARKLRSAGMIDFSVSRVAASVINKRGIVPAITLALRRSLEIIRAKQSSGMPQFIDSTLVLLDGGLKAPPEYVRQQTIVKGDSKEKVIGLASIVAKVTRDQYMERLAKNPAYVVYDFALHKGYGTKKHRAAILKHGLSIEHRASFCRRIMDVGIGKTKKVP
jgi:ribonuclease HII